MSANVQTVVFPAAGLGTRILPATKAFPKELLPLVDRPIIQYGVEEAVNSGIRRVVLVTKPSNTLTKAHFSADPELEAILEERGNVDALATVRALSVMAEVKTVHQEQPLGLGHAVLAAKSEVGDEPFAVVLPDDVIDATTPALQQMTDVFAEVGGPVLLVERVPPEAIQRYGIIDATPIRNGVFEIRDLVEKPTPEAAPSNLGIIGRYILTPDLFPALEKTAPSRDGEIQLTEGLRRLLHQRPLYACELTGVRHDTGTTIGFLQASVYFALKRPDLGPSLRASLRALVE
jgi:UTP--glucose-1-phosphate uridylyltransferase